MKTHKVMSVLFFLLVFTASTSWGADKISPDDFAYILKLEFPSGKSVYESPLPKTVYQSVTRSDLGDLRVFNSNSEVVPHEVTIQKHESREADVMHPKELNFFPLYAEHGKYFGMKGITITTNKLGTVVEVEAQTSNKQINRKILSGYLLDASTIKTPIKELLVEFGNPKNKQFFKEVNITGSDDLENWSQNESSSILANLVHQEESLVKNVISVPQGGFKYYRVSWSDPSEPVNISKMTACFGKKSKFEKMKLNWFTADGIANPKDDSTFLYKLSGYFPISSVQIEFTQPNSFGTVTLESRNNDSDQWELRKTKTVFSLVKDGAKLEENEISFSPKRFRYWRLKLNSQKAAFGSHVPKLKFGWAPEKLRFLARGNSPFSVGFGNARVDPLASVNLQNNNFSESIGIATVAGYKVLGGDSELTYLPPKVYPWKSWILWAVLVTGVCGLGKMALNLMKTMENEDKME